jgi:Right handed beta helix region
MIRTAATILTAAALAACTAGLAMARPGVAYASSAITIGNGDVGALATALADAPANGVAEVINLAANGTYPLTAVENDTYGPTGLPLIPAGANVEIKGHGATIERVGAPGIPDFSILSVPPSATLALEDVTISGGSVAGNGGGIEALGNLTVTSSTISGNTAGGNGGGINDDNSAGDSVTVSRSAISGNTAGGNGGGINDVSGQYDGNNGTLTVSQSAVSGNTASGDGGGVDAFGTISDSTFTGNAALDGGGIYNEDGANATVEDSTIDANTASDAGGGLYLSAANLLDSTVSGNTADGNGGGVFTNADFYGDFPYLEHDTITLNDGQSGSGLSIDNTFDTQSDSGVVSVGDSIISGNEGSQTDGDTNVGTVDNATGFGTYVFSMGYNLLGFSTVTGEDPAIGFFGGPGDQRGTSVPGVGYLGVNAWLGPLRSNGGPTKTQLPGHGSTAIDAGDNTLSGNPVASPPPPAPATDQRGLPRVVTLPGYPDLTDGTDIGAVELATAPAASLVVTTADDSLRGKSLSLRAAITEASAANVNTITFDIPGPGPHVIHLKSALPEITSTDNINIDNASGQPVVIEAPAGAGAFKTDTGSQLSLSGVTLRGDGTSGNGITSGGELDLTNSTVTGFGGTGIVVSESLTMSDSTVSDNGAGGIVDQFGGGTITITGSTFSGNHSGTSGGAIELGNLGDPAEVTITGSTFTGNSAAVNGGAIDMEIAEDPVMTIANCTMTRNTAAALGGAVYVTSPLMAISNTTMTGNTADTGGAIAALGSGLTVDASTLNGNKAIGGADPDSLGAGKGGGLFVNAEGSAVTNSTLSGNMAAGSGGGAYVNFGILTVSSSTITRNTAPAATGGGVAVYGGQAQTAQATVTNSIIDKNHGDDVDLTQGTDPPGFVSGGYNLIGTGNDVSAFNQAGDQTGVTTPKTGPLASNGGPTKTIALLTGSPAIGTGDNADCPATDQRGLPRPQGSGCDIGSFQVQTG